MSNVLVAAKYAATGAGRLKALICLAPLCDAASYPLFPGRRQTVRGNTIYSSRRHDVRPSGVDQIAAMRMFVRVVESGSFSAVARTTGVGQPAVGKQITSLEAHLGAQLLRRTSRSLGLTEAGQDLYGSAVRLIGDLEAAEPRGRRRQSAPSGLVRVTMAPVFGARMSLKGQRACGASRASSASSSTARRDVQVQ